MKYLLLELLFCSYALFASPVQLIKKENNDSNVTLLVIGGIHGNEPGGYFSASILAQHYTITSKNLWIVPNLNKESIIANRRGIHGDMNRKFAFIKKNDKDKTIVDTIKNIILQPQVSLILNLHDGHGFYRKNYKGSIFNPNAWGQTCVIDQCELNNTQPFGNLNTIAQTVRNNVNKKLLKKHHSFNVKNTKTKYEDEAMRLSLTYFAVTNNKPAFAIETSKNLSKLAQKVFYQLLAVEEYMKIVGITFHRDFDLTEQNIEKLLKNYGTLEINHNIFLKLSDIKKYLSYIPIKSKDNLFLFSNPLGMIKKKGKKYIVYVGNKKITTIKPQYFQLENNALQHYKMVIDGKKTSVPKASYIEVKNSFLVEPNKNYRVNIIGFSRKGHKDEAGYTVSRNDLNKRYALDKKHKSYRIEFYNKDKFCTMIVVHFK